MEHSEFKQLTAVLDSIIAVADLLHWADNEGRERMENKDINGVYYYRGYVEFLNRWWSSDIPTGLSRVWDYETGDLSTLKVIPRFEWVYGTMNACENGFFKENQERADNKLGPTRDFVSLYRSISRYLSGPGINDPWDHILREKLQEWRDQANGWFPDLNDQGNDQEPADRVVTSTPATITIDRDKMAGFFIAKFKVPRTRPGMEPLPPGFDMFYNALVTGTGNYTPTDIGRIAYQVQQSNAVLYQFKNMPFSKFARLFFEACGVPVPKDLAPRTYKVPTTATDFSIWLK